jgi:antitoxin HicB
MMLAYRVKFSPDDNGTVLVTCPALPEVTTFGEDEADAFKHAEAAIEEALAARISGGRDIPETSVTNKGPNILLPLLTTLKVELYKATRAEGVSRAELMRRMKPRNLKIHREQVDRLFRLDHASRLDQLEDAFKALHRQIDIDIEKVA